MENFIGAKVNYRTVIPTSNYHFEMGLFQKIKIYVVIV